MSSGVFFLDEDRDTSPSVSPQPSPPITADQRNTPSPTTSTSAGPSTTALLAPPLTTTASGSHQPIIHSPQPQHLISPNPVHRKHANSFAAAPSFPSPLAQAVTVPLNSDDSSSSSHSEGEGEGEGEGDGEEEYKAGRGSPTVSSASGTPKRLAEQIGRSGTVSPRLRSSRSASPASTQKSTSRPPSPAQRVPNPPIILTPGALLMKSNSTKRSSTGGSIAGSLPNITTAGPLRSSPPKPIQTKEPSIGTRRRLDSIARDESKTHARGRSASSTSSAGPSIVGGGSSVASSSPLAFGSPELFATSETSPRRRLSIGSPPSHLQQQLLDGKDANALGFWGTGWDASSASGSSSLGSVSGSLRDKGKGRESFGPPSPRRDKEISRTGSFGIASPPKARRPSEFLNPSYDGRKMPSSATGRLSMAGTTVASLSTSASMISPLNPLPSPWASSSDSSAFSPPNSQSSEMLSSTTPSSGGAAIRLNRVPTSVKLATELMKNPNLSLSPPMQQANTPSSGGTGPSTASVPTPNPSPVGSPAANPVQLASGRELTHTSSSPAALISSRPPSSLELGKGRPTLAVPPAPAPSRNVSSVDKAHSPASDSAINEFLRPLSSSNLAPPSSFKAAQGPNAPQPRLRPSLPTEAQGNSPLGDPFTTTRHRYRTSMHEASYRPIVLPDISASPPSWSSPPSAHDTGPSNSAQVTPTTTTGEFGLGFAMPPNTGHLLPPDHRSGSVTPGAPSRPRLGQATATGGLHMDLAGIGSMGDAASHASMIMQSRQAKLQRWRPNSAGNVNARADGLPPSFNRSITSALPARRSRPGQPSWAEVSPIGSTTASSPGEDLPPIPSAMEDVAGFVVVPTKTPLTSRSTDSTSQPTVTVNDGPSSRFAMGSVAAMGGGGTGMERTASASGTVGGIEWIDWYDCYKSFKEAKIRAEASARSRSAGQSNQVSPKDTANNSPMVPSPQHISPSSDHGSKILSPKEQQEVDLASSIEASSAIALTPTTSRDDHTTTPTAAGSGPGASSSAHFRRRSASIRSNLSAIDPRLSPSSKMASIFERPRQSSSSSTKSTDTSSGAAAATRKRKNLVTKMEGWWNAVKSNFIPESQHPPYRPSTLGPNITPRIPSAPASRRGSEMSPNVQSQSSMLPPLPPIRRDSASQLLRPAASHAELRSKGNRTASTSHASSSNLIGSTSADLTRLSRLVAQGIATTSVPGPASAPVYSAKDLMLPPPIPVGPRAPSTVIEESIPGTSRSSLDSRRKQPNLRLELEPHVLSHEKSFNTDSSGSNSERIRPPIMQRPTESSRSSSYSQPKYGPGLTPGIPKWEHTPEIFAVNSTAKEARENKPVAPGADITIGSVRRHIKHRMAAAKEACDGKLRETIGQMTRFAEERKEEELIESVHTDEAMRDYFEGISDSPIIDAEESEAEGNDMFSDSRSRNVSSSRGPSRRASISRPVGSLASSPTRRTSMLPSSPSRIRRRTSTAPRAYVKRDRMARNLSLSFDKAQSTSSSRSTSRSRSPMPISKPLLDSGTFDAQEAAENDRRFLAAVQELIVLATDMMETSVNSLVARPSICTDIIQKLQTVGAKWDDHDDWPGRDWYVQSLMAVANLSRVLDWWEAEKGFWNFDDEDENEPILFVMRPGKEESGAGKAGLGMGLDGDYFRTGPGLGYDKSPAPRKLSLPPVPAGVEAGTVELTSPSTGTTGPATAKMPITPGIAGTPKAQAVEDLRFLAEQAKSVNIVMELSLQGEEIQYINDAIMEVTGRDPEEVMCKPIADILAPADASTFTEATQKLMEDDNNTIQLRVRFEVHEDEREDDSSRQPGPVYIELEGVGMLMRENGEASHTMWVLKPVPAIHYDNIMDAAFPKDGNIINENILCRICEREIVTWFFEKHNETCDAVHRLEAEITESNDCLHDLHQTANRLNAEIDGANEAATTAQYQGVLFFTLPDSITGATDHDLTEPQGVEIRKITQDHLREAIEILSIAKQIESPSVRDEEADLPFTLQRYIDPDSEEKLAIITRWQKPPTTDRALGLLFSHVEEQLRRKQKAIARLQSTIRYSEKTRHEWEDKVDQILASREEGSSDGGGSEGDPRLSPTEGNTTVVEGPETSPPGHRRIAPQARLPITQGHPQRPTTAGGGETSGQLSLLQPTPVRETQSADASPAQDPPASAVPVTSTPEFLPVPAPEKSGAKLPSPLLTPTVPDKLDAGKFGHLRRRSIAPGGPLLSPRIPSAALPARAPPSINDFEILKPISRGAFGSVYLARKVATGDYYAIKALKKSDMIAKNQITNVKAERTILMNQASSPYVVKLFFSFQSKDFLYLVMEYLNGGDCATLVKTLGGLPEEWARNYIAEVVLGLEYLHARNIVHRDIKPDNILIDSRGHLKLTDFGLSRIGLLNRQVGGPRPAFLRGTSLRGSTHVRVPLGNRTSSTSSTDSPMISPEIIPPPTSISTGTGQSYFTSTHDSGSADESSGSESAGIIPRHLRPTSKQSSDPNTPSVTGAEPPRFVGTPDYLAPESILGIGSDDRAVDWWALGVVLYEFIYGVPPFHAETPEKVFDNVISRRILWHEDDIELSPEARDLMERLMTSNPAARLGARGAEEVKQHAFFAGIDWESLCTAEASFVPEVTDPTSTDYFDARGATHGFHDDGGVPQVTRAHNRLEDLASPAAQQMVEIMQDMEAQDDFGQFNFKNLPVLKQANDDVIRKMRVDSMAPLSQALESAMNLPERPRSTSAKTRHTAKRKNSDLSPGPPSPSTSTSSAASTPSRSSIQPTTPGTGTVPPLPLLPQHYRRPSELNALDRVKSTDEGDLLRRSSAPSRIRAGSGSSHSDRSTSMELWRQRRQASMNTDVSGNVVNSSSALGLQPLPDTPDEIRQGFASLSDRSLDCLIAEDNPISQKILETLLTRMGCRCVCVDDGSQALASTMGGIRFDVIIVDIHMPVVNGEQVARMIRSTNNHNQNTPIIATTSYEQSQAITEEGTLFSAILPKPVDKNDLIKCLDKLGFILSSTADTASNATALTD